MQSFVSALALTWALWNVWKGEGEDERRREKADEEEAKKKTAEAEAEKKRDAAIEQLRYEVKMVRYVVVADRPGEAAGTCWGYHKGQRPLIGNFSNGWDDKYTRDEEEKDDDVEIEDEDKDEDEDSPESF